MRPESEEELAALVAGAAGPLKIVGGGTRDVGRPVAGEVLSTAGLTGVRLYEPGALTLVVGAGTPLAEVEAVLAEQGQRLAFEPIDHRALLGTAGAPTIGGVFAANASGPRRVNVGAARDFLLGVRFIDGAGRVVKNGGRVMKNVTGYDLVKLMAGSWGTLGVLSEVSLKVLAEPAAEMTLVARGLAAEAGVAALTAALGSPYDVTGAAHLDEGVAGAAETRVRIEGLPESVAYRGERLGALLEGFAPVEGAASAALWREVRDVTPFAGRAGAVWRVSLRPSRGVRLTEALGEAGLAHRALRDWGGGLLWLLVEDGGDAGAALLRARLAELGGHATLVRAAPETRAVVPVFQPEPAPVAALSAGLRARFDPRGILNPGLMA
ncbi:putative glycolate oxidase subunit protein [Oceanicola granulosus HTCC2516]|uniref:Putative glycolate oxidase subunit protein n=1 Tax=Oceanicola granulosus (strain ATCC BAA-861 / DSM 15982 / KCTC 12143 / HTCC2516) TaxID=314256 RepID=Q2CB57_OCEGH|nr:FAD-binding protein [Oceanicola granulosus]EAR49928.1 putative glycolate oxidase subunit protein [Oceanicola granulosus HTCC2516]